MERHPKITCEVCGQGEILDADNIRNIYRAIDLWVCDHCAYVYSFILGHVRQASSNAKQQGDLDQVEKGIKEMEKISALYPINKALPRINNQVPYCDRMDSLIVEDDA